ncbi:aminoglycoside 6-adenylyltransferase [bacterium]|nr:aminoglycoside 6-adenylyltransferase [bacterium]
MTYEEIIKRSTVWADVDPNILGLFIVGSRAREISPADQWSDLDLVVLVNDSSIYINDTEWITHIGEPRIIFLEKTAVGDEKEIRIIFDGGLDVDFALIPIEKIKGHIEAFISVAFRGIKILVDKIGLTSEMKFIESKMMHKPPSYFEFSNSVKDFWYHSVWTAKKLLRGELWTAKTCCDVYMKETLLKMVEWYMLSKNGWDYDVWHRGRFLEKWADPQIIEQLKRTYAYYDRDDIKRALLETMDLYRWISIETARNLGYEYPKNEEEYATYLVKRLLETF